MATRSEEVGEEPNAGRTSPTPGRRTTAPRAAQRGQRSRTAVRAQPFSPHAEGPLAEDLRRFIREHAEGWGHREWLALLDQLRERGHDVGDSEAVGRLLERERLITRLERVRGVGPQRIGVIADRYPSLWSLRQADVEELARVTEVPRAVAQRIKDEV